VARPCILILIVLLACAAPCGARQEYEITIETSLGDSTETFWLQIPTFYHPGVPAPLLIGWHQLAGGRREMRDATDFDLEADMRGWIAASMDGPIPAHWNNHAAQSHMVDVIRWIEEHYEIDPDRIYMVGASMGGAAGMVFSNNHLDPAGPMVAAAASISGIQDCERRFHEQGTNTSMIAAFGGTPEEVPFTYHRNSAIDFDEPAQSMHVNARHLPLYLTFGRGITDSIWRAHAEDLYTVMTGFADKVVLRESTNGGHGWACAEEARTCAFLAGCSLVRDPARISIRADEDGAWYWVDLVRRVAADSFAGVDAAVNPQAARIEIDFVDNVASATLDLTRQGFPLGGRFDCRWTVADPGLAVLAFRDVPGPPAAVLRDGQLFTGWSYDAGSSMLRFEAEGTGLYTVLPDVASSSEATAGTGAARIRVWQAGAGTLRYAPMDSGPIVWRLYDVLGRIVDEGEGRNGSIDLRDRLPSGNYRIRLKVPEVRNRSPKSHVITRSVTVVR
jgi:poly(3-hydroxybutyrate) depolymerase